VMVDTTTPADAHGSEDSEERTELGDLKRQLQEYQNREMTTSRSVRWEWLATAVAGLTILSFLALVVGAAVGVVTLTFPQPWFLLFSTAVAGCYAWVLGKDYINLGK